MDRLPFIVDRLKQPPFEHRIATLAEFDGKSGMELLDIVTEILGKIDSELLDLPRDNFEVRIGRIVHFLKVMKFNIPGDQIEQFQDSLMGGDMEVLHSIIYWTLQKFDHLKKRAYLSRYLLPVDVSPDFMGDPRIEDLSQRLKEMQAEFKEVHKMADQNRVNNPRPNDLKSEISQLEQERTQLQNKINRLKKEVKEDETYFNNMLKATSKLRKEQEEEARIYDKMREQRGLLQRADAKCNETARRLADTRNSNSMSQSPEELLSKLQAEVRGLIEKKDAQEGAMAEKNMHLEKLMGWENSDRVTTEEDVRQKRIQVREEEQHLQELQLQLDAALERNPKLSVFRQASTMAQAKLREKEVQAEKLDEERRRLVKQAEDREAELQQARGKKNPAMAKIDLKKYGAQVREKIEKYKKMREELSGLRSELVVLQRTEQILKGKLKNLDDFLSEVEKKKGISVCSIFQCTFYYHMHLIISKLYLIYILIATVGVSGHPARARGDG